MSDRQNVLAWNALKSTRGIGPKSLVNIALRLGEQGLSVEECLGASAEWFGSLGLNESQAADAAISLSDPSCPAEPPSGCLLLTPDDIAYPRDRLDVALPLPVLLYVSGNVSLFRARGAAISGSRSAPPLVLEYVHKIAEVLAEEGLTVISGHAAGVDEIAHAGALEVGGSTIAVIPHGFSGLKLRPGLHEADETSLLLASGFEPLEPWSRYHAMTRNIWIAALADFVIVAAAGLKGGSWAQGELCLKAGKKLLIPDFSAEVAPGNQQLIDRGAIVLDSSDPKSVLRHLEPVLTTNPTVQSDLFDRM